MRSVIVGLPVSFRGIKISIVAQKWFYGQFVPPAVKGTCEVSDIFCLILTKFGVRRQIFVTVPSMKVACNPCSGSRADTRRQTDRQTAEMAKLIGAFRDCANETTKPDL